VKDTNSKAEESGSGEAESDSEAKKSSSNAKGIWSELKVSNSRAKGIDSEAQVERTLYRVPQGKVTRRELQHCSVELIMEGGPRVVLREGRTSDLFLNVGTMAYLWLREEGHGDATQLHKGCLTTLCLVDSIFSSCHGRFP
jgi:hypothetical protein